MHCPLRAPRPKQGYSLAQPFAAGTQIASNGGTITTRCERGNQPTRHARAAGRTSSKGRVGLWRSIGLEGSAVAIDAKTSPTHHAALAKQAGYQPRLLHTAVFLWRRRLCDGDGGCCSCACRSVRLSSSSVVTQHVVFRFFPGVCSTTTGMVCLFQLIL